jgi:hypothetical protein
MYEFPARMSERAATVLLFDIPAVPKRSSAKSHHQRLSVLGSFFADMARRILRGSDLGNVARGDFVIVRAPHLPFHSIWVLSHPDARDALWSLATALQTRLKQEAWLIRFPARHGAVHDRDRPTKFKLRRTNSLPRARACGDAV